MNRLKPTVVDSPDPPPPGQLMVMLRAAGKAWMFIGHAMSRITTPLVLGALYFGVLTPIALVARLCGHDPLCLRRPQQATYWADSTPMARAAFRQQF